MGLSHDLLEKIKDYYNPKIEGKGSLIFHTKDGKKRYLPMYEDKKVILTFGESVNSEQEAIEKGFLHISIKELSQALFPKEYQEYYYDNHIEERTQKYLDEIRQSSGFLRYKADWNNETFEIIEQYDFGPGLTGSGYVDVGQLPSGEWVAQFSMRTAIDDYVVVKIYFNHKPSKKDIITANDITEVEGYFARRGYKGYTYKCWECGREVHWIDNGGKTLEEKFSMLQEQYCGC